jgi:shikimate dehydrogenase
MPLKAAVVPLLDELATDLGVVNTVVVSGDRLVGHNTDVEGIRAGLAALGDDGGPIAVLGAGGTAHAALAALAGRAVTLHVRDLARAAGAREVAARYGVRLTVMGLDEVPAGVGVVSTLPPGVPAVVTSGPLLDVVYAPWPTPTAAAALATGARVVDGRAVLLGQAAAQVQLMTGRRPPENAMLRAFGEASSGDRSMPTH